MSVPALSGPYARQTPGTPQKTITELLAQFVTLTEAAIAATGVPDEWMGDTDNKPWDPAAEDVGLSPCSSVGSKDASQVSATVYHAAFEHDPHPIADKMTAYWKEQGFTVERTVDWTAPDGTTGIEIRADRADGVEYGLGVTNERMAIRVDTECSAHSSIHDWALERSLRDLNAPSPTPTPTPAPSASAADTVDDDGWVW